MKEKAKMGRPPAPWMFNFVDLKLEEKWTDAHKIAKKMNLQVNTVKSFFHKVPVTPKYEVINGAVRAKFKVSELKKATKDYLKPWQ